MSSIFAQLPNRLIMDIVKIRLDADFAEAERKRIEYETLIYWTKRSSPQGIMMVMNGVYNTKKKQLKAENPRMSKRELDRRASAYTFSSSNQDTKWFITYHISSFFNKAKFEGYDLDSLYSDQAFYILRQGNNRNPNGRYTLTNATLRRRDNQ